MEFIILDGVMANLFKYLTPVKALPYSFALILNFSEGIGTSDDYYNFTVGGTVYIDLGSLVDTATIFNDRQ